MALDLPAFERPAKATSPNEGNERSFIEAAVVKKVARCRKDMGTREWLPGFTPAQGSNTARHARALPAIPHQAGTSGDGTVLSGYDVASIVTKLR